MTPEEKTLYDDYVEKCKAAGMEPSPPESVLGHPSIAGLSDRLMTVETIEDIGMRYKNTEVAEELGIDIEDVTPLKLECGISKYVPVTDETLETMRLKLEEKAKRLTPPEAEAAEAPSESEAPDPQKTHFDALPPGHVIKLKKSQLLALYERIREEARQEALAEAVADNYTVEELHSGLRTNAPWVG